MDSVSFCSILVIGRGGFRGTCRPSLGSEMVAMEGAGMN